MLSTDITHIMDALGWTIFHSIWQIFLIATVAAVFLYILRDMSARFKYTLAYAAMILSFVWVIHTFAGQLQNTLHSQFADEVGLQRYMRPATGFDNLNGRMMTIPDRFQEYLPGIRSWLSENAGIMSIVWLFGIALLSVKTMGGFWYIWKIKQGKKQAPTYAPHSLVRKMARQMKVWVEVRIYESLKVSIPVVLGVLKPVILVPVGFFSGLPLNQVEAILAHELAHVKRFDYLFNILQTILEIIFFYHPAFWWISSVVRREREYCCDDLAMTICEEELTYIRALSRIQDLKYLQHQNNNIMVAFFNKKYELLARVQRILKQRREKHYSVTLPVFAVLVLFGLLALKPVSSTMLHTQDGSVGRMGLTAIHMVSSEPGQWNIGSDMNLWTPADTVNKKVKKNIKEQDPQKEGDLETEFDMDMDVDWDFDIDLDVPEFEFPDTLQFQWGGIHGQLNDAFSHFGFITSDFHVSDSFFMVWDDIRIDIQDAFKDFESDFPEMEFCDSIQIDKEALRKNMDKLRKEMEYFNSEDFRLEMERARIEMQESIDLLKKEMKEFREREWPRIKEEIEKTLDEQRKQNFKSETDTLKLHYMGLSVM